MSKELNSNNYVVIQGWMCNELGLKGNELLIFALIYGFSQDGDTRFYGSRSYMANTFNISLPTVDKAIDNLEEKNLIEVTLVDDAKTGKHNEYQVNQKQINYLTGVVKKLYEGSKETLHNNTSNNINNKSISKDIDTKSETSSVIDKVKPKKLSLYDKCVNMINEFTDDTILQELLVASLRLFLENSKESSTPFYSNTFKGKLNNLRKLSDDDYDLRSIVQQTLDNGWNNFYEVKRNNKSKNKTGNFARDVEHLTGGLNRKADKRGDSNEAEKF